MTTRTASCRCGQLRVTTSGSPVYHSVDGEMRGLTAVAVGAFDEPFYAQPLYSVYEDRKQPWVEIVGDGIEHFE